MRIVGTANLSQAKAEVAKLKAQVDALNASMAATHKAGPWSVNPRGYAQMSQQIANNSQVYRNAAASTGMFEVQQLRVNSATEEYTRLLDKQKVSFRDWAKQRRVSAAAYKEQLALSQMMVRELPGRTADGRRMLDISFPTEVHKDLDTMGNRIGWIREQTRSAATQMVNWGKNTQWAGRQLMVGFTMPVAAFGAAAGVPIMPSGMEPEFTAYDKPFIVYGYSEDATPDLYAHRGGSLSYAVWSTNTGEVNTILNTIRAAMERHDETAAQVNHFTSQPEVFAIYGKIRFGSISVGYFEGPSPEETEGGRKAGVITLRYGYYADYPVKVFRNGTWS